MKRPLLSLIILLSLAAGLPRLLTGCNKAVEIRTLTPYALPVPPLFPAPLYNNNENPLSREGIELGRRLFYEKKLSIDNEHPCSSCHEQRSSFGTFEHDRSHGVYNSHTLRNAPVLVNLAWAPYFHWDGQFESLALQATHPITGDHEMGETFPGIIRKLEADPSYKKDFQHVFKTTSIEPLQIVKALAQFTATMISANSRYDQYKKGLVPFTSQEQAGYQVFLQHCNSCHREPLFTDHSFRNIGLPIDPTLNDLGRMRITFLSSDSLKFKVPTLRNCYLSSNYMHDGRFISIQQCINHYRFQVQPGATVDPLLRQGIAMSNQQADQLMAFLKTLTDSSFVTDRRLARPE
jgi:cytochrome c peroxidase